MRLLKWLFGWVFVFCLLAVLVIWIAGYRSNRGYFETSVLISAPQEAVYRALLDPEFTKLWVSGVSEIKTLTPGAVHVGTKRLLLEKINRRDIEMLEEFTNLDPPNLIEYKTKALGSTFGQFEEVGSYILEKEGDSTLVTLTSQITYQGTLYRFLEPLLTYSLSQKFSQDQQTMKHLLETKYSKRKISS